MFSADLESRLLEFLMRFDRLLPKETSQTDWSAPAYRWRKKNYFGTLLGELEPIPQITETDPDDILHQDKQKEKLLANTRQFVRGYPANNVLLTGSRGTGKSSLIRACLTQYCKEGLRLIEVDKSDLGDLLEIAEAVKGRPEKFIIFCDDLSFEQGEGSYKALKVMLDGTVSDAARNLLIYATSNRRHLVLEKMSENLESSAGQNGEIHPGETVEEHMSLSERFGLWLTFYPFSQDEYLEVAKAWIERLGARPEADWETEALQFALQRGSRSGRVASQFARDWVGMKGMRRHQRSSDKTRK